MSVYSSSNHLSSSSNVPGCDAWGNFTVGSANAVSFLDGYGILGVSRASTGLYGISFSNPERFASGAYVVIATPELAVDGTGITTVSGYGPIAVVAPNGKTGAGISAGLQIKTLTYPNGFHTGGGTAAQNDPQTGAVRVNLAAFSFATDSDLRNPIVANLIPWSEKLDNWTVVAPAQLVSAPNVVDPFGNANSVWAFNSITTVSNYIYNYTGLYDKTYTWSVYAKSNGGVTLEMLFGGVGNNFGYEYNLLTGAVNSTGIVPSGGLRANGKVQFLSNGWCRLSMTGSVPSSASVVSQRPTPIIVNSTYANNNFYLFGAQIQEGSVVTPYIKTEATVPVYGNQSDRKALVPGEGGFGKNGNTYASSHSKPQDKRRAVAYGTIVIPPNMGAALVENKVAAYIENGFNVQGVSAGNNSLFDVSFVKPMANDNYCVILSGEHENSSTTGSPEEYSLLLVRAGATKQWKTINGFRIEELKQDTSNNSWVNSSLWRRSGLSQRIHFMVFGEYTQGQSYLVNPSLSLLSPTTNSLDYEVWASSWIDPLYGKNMIGGITAAGYDNTPPANNQPLSADGIKAIVPLAIGYDTGGLKSVRTKDLGHTGATPQLISRTIDRMNAIPKQRRAWYPRHIPPITISPHDAGDAGDNTTYFEYHSALQYWAQTEDGVSYGSGWYGYGNTAALTTAVGGRSLSTDIIVSSDNQRPTHQPWTTKYWEREPSVPGCNVSYGLTHAFGWTAERNRLGGYTGMILGATLSVGDTGITLTFASAGWTLQYNDTLIGITGGVARKFYVGTSTTSETYGITGNAGEYKFVRVQNASGVTFNMNGSTFDAYKRVVIPGATLVAGRKMISLFPDKQVEYHQQLIADYLDRCATGVVHDRTGYTPTPVEFAYIFDDHEDIDYLGSYYMGVQAGIIRRIVVRGSGVTSFGPPPSGGTLRFLYDDFGVSAGYTGFINSADPDYMRAMISDPRVTSYKFDPNGVTTESSHTLNSRFMEFYNRMVQVYGKGNAPSGATATSMIEAVEWAYLAGKSYSPPGTSFANMPGTDWTYLHNAYVGGGGRSVQNIARHYFRAAYDAAVWDLLDNHYRMLVYKPAIQRGVVVGNYQQGYSTVEDAMYLPGGNMELRIYPPSSSGRLIQPNFYGKIGNYEYTSSPQNIGNIAAYVFSPTTHNETYWFGGVSSAGDNSFDYNPKSGCVRFFDKTGLIGPAAWNAVGVTLSPVSGLSAAASFSSTDTGITAWRGFTYVAGDILRVGGKGITIFSYITGGAAGVGGKVYVQLHGQIGSNGVEGDTFHVYKSYNNPGFLAFICDLRQLRLIQRCTPDAHTRFIPWISSPHWTTYGYWKDRRYWWELCYHLYLGGASAFTLWQDSGASGKADSPTARSKVDGDQITFQKMLDNIRNISGNGKCGQPMVTSIQPLGDTIYVSGAKLVSGLNAGMYLWRITVAPGAPGQTIQLVQSSRNDIPKTIYLNDLITPESPHGNRGVWLLTKSSVVPSYSIG